MVRLPPTLRLFRCPTADRVAARELQEATRRKQDESSMVVVACRAKMRAAMSQSKVMPLYKGRLSAGQIAAGMNAARKNAKRLLEDAKLLLEAKRFPTACSLAILSIEEFPQVTNFARDGKRTYGRRCAETMEVVPGSPNKEFSLDYPRSRDERRSNSEIFDAYVRCNQRSPRKAGRGQTDWILHGLFWRRPALV